MPHAELCRLRLTWCLLLLPPQIDDQPNIYLNIDILEHEKSESSSIGSKLTIEDDDFADLDEIIYRYVHPLIDHARSVVSFRKFVDKSKEDILAQMKEDQNNGGQTPYYLTVNRDPRFPGRFCLYYMRKTKHHMEDVKCTHKGFRYRNEYHSHPEKLTAYFKKNCELSSCLCPCRRLHSEHCHMI